MDVWRYTGKSQSHTPTLLSLEFLCVLIICMWLKEIVMEEKEWFTEY